MGFRRHRPPPLFPRRRESGLFGFSCFWVSGNFQIVIPAQAGIQTIGQRQYSKVGGFAFEVQLSLTEKGQYAVAYGLSCKKDCHELHATDP
ncbi:hypothetical protein, partial [Neisseria meningitidis]|uniref:hypothetical protein n=5 Tax=Neisseria meningitidis TaxID=487 RepID=UPI001C5BA94D